MNIKLKSLTLAALLALSAGDSFADSGSKTTPCYFSGKTLNVDSGCTLNVKSGGTLNLQTGSTETNQATKTSGGSTDVSGIKFSSAAPSSNPLVQMTVQDIPASFISTGSTYAFLSGVTGKTIYPGVPVIMVSGTAGGATSLTVKCTSGNVLGTFPIAALVDGKPVTPFASVSTISSGKAFSQGCASGDSVLLSASGSALTTTTDVYINMPYTVQ